MLVPGLDAEHGLRRRAEPLREAISPRRSARRRLRADRHRHAPASPSGAGSSARAPDVEAADRALYAGQAPRPRPRAAGHRACAPATPERATPTRRDWRRRSRSPSRSARACPRSTASRWPTSPPASPSTSGCRPRCCALRLGGWLHDVGKIAIPDGSWQARARSTTSRVGGHAGPRGVGDRGGRRVPGLELARRRVRHHHERLDGTGYPDGRRGDDIALEARIVACADAYSAITSDRVYRPRAHPRRGHRRARRSAGSHLDPRSWRRWSPCWSPTRRTSPRASASPAERPRPQPGRVAMLRPPRAWRNR